MSGIALFLYYYKQFYYDIPTHEHGDLLPATKFAPLIFLKWVIHWKKKKIQWDKFSGREQVPVPWVNHICVKNRWTVYHCTHTCINTLNILKYELAWHWSHAGELDLALGTLFSSHFKAHHPLCNHYFPCWNAACRLGENGTCANDIIELKTREKFRI